MSFPDYTITIAKFEPFFSLVTTLSLFTRNPLPIWPEGISFLAWKNFLISFLWFLGSSDNSFPHKPRKRKRISRRYRKFLRKKEEEQNKFVKTHTAEADVANQLEAPKTANSKDIKLELITVLKKFWEKKNISLQIENTIPDERNKDLITYTKQTIMMSALSIFLFRMGSGNQFDRKSHDKDEKYSIKNIAKFIDAPEDRVPVIKTIETFLANLNEDSINELMISFFKDLQRSKFFKQHSQIMPGEFFLLAADCVHTHTYNHPHHVDDKGNNDCPCCLKRVYNKGTKREKTKWIHNTLVFSFVFMGGLKIPIYRYPIHAKQVTTVESASEDEHKQECESVALKAALPCIRKAFSKMKIVLLLDGLYANRPIIRLAEENRCGYIIVRKEECLTLLGKECNEKATKANHKKNCVKKGQRTVDNGWSISEKYMWFNNSYLGDNISTNVLRYWETRTKEGEEAIFYKCEWLFSWRLSAKNCVQSVQQARARWEIEDLFNTLKNREFNLKHDYSRNPQSCFNWQGLALFAFGIFELFRFSQAVTARGNWTQIGLAEKLLGQLLHRTTEELFNERCLSKRIQFRYHFIVKPVFYQEACSNSPKEKRSSG